MAEHAHSTPASALLRAVPLSLWPEAVRERRRRLLRQVRTAERLLFTFVERLDELTPNPDLEDCGDDEPSLCGVGAQHIPFTNAWGPYIDVEAAGEDQEGDEAEDREPDCDAEPDANSAGYL